MLLCRHDSFLKVCLVFTIKILHICYDAHMFIDIRRNKHLDSVTENVSCQG